MTSHTQKILSDVHFQTISLRLKGPWNFFLNIQGFLSSAHFEVIGSRLRNLKMSKYRRLGEIVKERRGSRKSEGDISDSEGKILGKPEKWSGY